MTRTVDLTGVSGSQPANLSFWTSFNTEADWDFVFVEAQTINPDGSGAGDFTTLPDAERVHERQHRLELSGGLGGAPPDHGALPDAGRERPWRRRQQVRADRYDRLVERVER